MRLLQRSHTGEFSLTKDLFGDDPIPPYAILSHTWNEGREVTYRDLMDGTGKSKSGYDKIRFCGQQANQDGLQYFWVDTCCIDKLNHVELQEAINTMFRWYQNAVKCYVYLSDVSTAKRKAEDQFSKFTWELAFRESRWFTRGWTLQELIAPDSVEFFSQEGKRLGDKRTLERQIHEITGIAIPALRGAPLSQFSIDERLSWAENRKTTRKEDKAYSLLGIFGIYIPLIYGEGEENAFKRLKKKTDKPSKERPKTVVPPGLPDRREYFRITHSADRNISYEETQSDVQRKEMLNLLRFDQIDARLMSLKTAQAKTCRWLLQNSQYKDWLDAEELRNHNGFFWIKGKPGTGKSIMMKFLFLEAKKTMKGSVVISFFFNARGGDLEKSTMGLYRSLLLQLLEKMPDIMSFLDHYGTHGLEAIKKTGWEPEMLKEIFTLVVDQLQDRRVFCYVDALDECPEDDVRDMISLFEEIGAREKSGEFRVCFSSRHYPEITIKTGLQLVLEREQDHGDDISLYIESQLKIENSQQAEDIKDEILRKSSGIFLWVALVIPILNKEHDRGRMKALKRRLYEIPTGLHDLFLDILTRDCKNVDEMALCIQCILFAKRPLSPQELQVALLTRFEDQPQDPFDASEVTSDVLRKFILDVSKGLAEITKSKPLTVQFIHESVRDFLLKEGGIDKLPIRGKNIEGQSHDTFTRICCLQLGVDIKAHVPDTKYPSYRVFSITNNTEALNKFPFLEYAVNHILYHANAAQRLGVSQELFLERLDLERWILLYNAFQKHSSHTYRERQHLLYILSEQGAGALIRIHPERSRHLSLEGGRFKFPLIAALYSGNADAARALVGIDPSGDSQSDEAQRDRLDNPKGMRFEAFRVSRSLISYLSEFGDTILLRKVLETGEYNLSELGQSIRSGFEDNPLYYASSEDVVELLIEFAADIDLFPGISQMDAVTDTGIVADHESCYLPLFQQMLERFPHLLNQGGKDGQTFLAYAAERGFEQLAKLAILRARDAVDETDSRGRTPFSFAAQGRTNHAGRLAIMKDLYEAQANPNTPDRDGKTPLHYAVVMPFNDEIIRFLSSISRVSLEQKDHRQLTALALAVQECRKGYVELLLAAGADPRALLPDGGTMLTYCVKMGYLGIFRALLGDTRCEPDAPDSNGRTALSWCASVGEQVGETMMSILLELETVDRNSRDNEGRTALERTIRGAQPAMVSRLCSRVGFLDLRDGRGVNLLRLVATLCEEQNCLQFHEITRLLLASGHVKPHSRGLQHLLELCKSWGLEEISQMIATFLEGGDLGPPLMAYAILQDGRAIRERSSVDTLAR